MKGGRRITSTAANGTVILPPLVFPVPSIINDIPKNTIALNNCRRKLKLKLKLPFENSVNSGANVIKLFCP
jgi:hypothetical protein